MISLRALSQAYFHLSDLPFIMLGIFALVPCASLDIFSPVPLSVIIQIKLSWALVLIFLIISMAGHSVALDRYVGLLEN